MAVLVDNASIHNRESEGFIKYCDKMDIKILQNVPYRPDFNGIEMAWGGAKREYRKRLDLLKANGVQWNNLQIVEEVVKNIPADKSAEFVRCGLREIEKGNPVFPKRFVEGPHHRLQLEDLRGLVKRDPALERKYEEHQQRKALQLVAAEGLAERDASVILQEVSHSSQASVMLEEAPSSEEEGEEEGTPPEMK